MMRLLLILAALGIAGCSTVPPDLLSQPHKVTNTKTGKPVVVKARRGVRTVKRVPAPKTAAPAKASPVGSVSPPKRKGVFRRTWDRIRGR